MNYEIKMTYEAETEVLDSANWYDSEKMGVGDLFLEEFNKVIQRIARNPYAFPVWEGVVRRALVSKYPFQIKFWNDLNGLLVQEKRNKFELNFGEK